MIVNILYPLQLNYMITVMVINHIIILPSFSALQLPPPPPPQLMESCFSLESRKQPLPQTSPAWILQQPMERSCLEPEPCLSFERAVMCPFSSIISERLSAPGLSSQISI